MMTLMIQLKSLVLTFESWTSFSIITKKMAMAILVLKYSQYVFMTETCPKAFFQLRNLYLKKSGCNSFLTDLFYDKLCCMTH